MIKEELDTQYLSGKLSTNKDKNHEAKVDNFN